VSELPDRQLACLRAVRELEQETFEMNGVTMRRLRPGVSASDVAYKLKVEPAARLGRGAVKGSWSGFMAPALRVAPALRAMAREGLLVDLFGERSVSHYLTTEHGRELLEEARDRRPDMSWIKQPAVHGSIRRRRSR